MSLIDRSPGVWDDSLPPARAAAMLAHDIRSALNGILGGIALIERAQLDAEVRVQFERVAAAAEALAALVAEATGEPPPAPEGLGSGDGSAGVDLAAFLGFVERRWRGEARAKGLDFRIEADVALPTALKVPFLDLWRTLCNLVGNAIKFSLGGTIRLRARRADDGGVLFEVEDDGPGLGAGPLDRAFEYGYRDAGVAEPGDGIGLHIVKRLADRMGGTVTLANRDAGGAQACLHLPGRLCIATGATGSGAPPDSGDCRDGRRHPDLTGLRILLAEDNPTNRMVASQMLRALEAEVIQASDGVEALALFEREDVHMVLVDIEMPRKSGLDVIRAIRARADRKAHIPIVALTAYSMKEHRARISEAGANGLIAKPITSIEAFGRAIEDHLRAHGRATAAPLAAAPEAGATEGAVDRAIYDGLAQAIGAEMMAELLDRILGDLESNRAALRLALERGDTAAIRASSHILISVGGAFGATRLEARARALNAAAHAGASDELAAGVWACLIEIDAAADFVRAERARC